MSSIKLSPRHGVNPAIPKCFFCGKDKNMIILAGRMRDDREAPNGACWDKVPCDECAGYMKQGIICISVREGEQGDNPYRTGKFAVVTEEAMERVLGETSPALLEHVRKARVCFIDDTTWAAIGLPEAETK